MHTLRMYVLAIACTSCVADRHLHQLPIETPLPWLVPGKTFRADIEQRFGRAALSIEGHLLAVWSLVPDEAGGLQRRPTHKDGQALGHYVRAKEENEISLVVDFDEQLRAVRASLVKL